MSRAIVLAHFDPAGGFDPHVVHALGRYRPLADRLVVVSASCRRLPAEASRLVDGFLPRANVGYDFCSWRAGLESLGDPSSFDEVVCVNDSVYGPVFDLAPAFTDPRVAEADLWGMVLSRQDVKRSGRLGPRPHVQSWFFAMRRPLLASAAFGEFWRSVEPQAAKDAVIDRYEIGMSEHFTAAGFRIAGLYDQRIARPVSLAELWPHLSLAAPLRSRRLLRKSRRMHNPAELLWRRLLEAGVPYVKVSLLKVNYYGLDLAIVREGLRGLADYDAALVEAHLARVRPAA
jgi:lipopolysaccharide biosynthesis protein